MNNEGQQFKKLARRVKWQRWLVTVGITVVVMIIGGLAFLQFTKVRSQRATNQINASFDVTDTIMSPNIQVSDQYLFGNSFSGGTVVSHRYKEIDGAREAWSPLQASYTWLLGSSTDAVNPTDITDTAAYDRVTQKKIPLFYNLRVKSPNVKVAHEVKQVAKTRHYRAEVALTFKTPLTVSQIQKNLPAGVHANWYWAGVSGKADTTSMDNNFVGVQAEKANHLTTTDYQAFRRAAMKNKSGLTYDKFDVLHYANQYARKYPQLSQAKFAGVIVTGNSEKFKSLVQSNWLYASSVGYFQPRTGIK